MRVLTLTKHIIEERVNYGQVIKDLFDEKNLDCFNDGS